MSEINQNQAPYNDRFDPEKNRTKVLFRPDRPLQQAELNELQSIQEHNVRQLGDSIFADGDIQTGMSFSVTNGKLKVEDGLVYLAGRVRTFKEQEIDFTGVGNEKIGIKLTQSVITSDDDPTLLDQTQGVESFMSAGADRLAEVVTLTHNDEAAPSIYEFNDGN